MVGRKLEHFRGYRDSLFWVFTDLYGEAWILAGLGKRELQGKQVPSRSFYLMREQSHYMMESVLGTGVAA